MKAPFTHANPKGGKAPKQSQHFSNNQSPFGAKQQRERVPKPAPKKLPKSLNDLLKK
ncbi:hypothetical protein MXMO3_01260 [Maritalea myrionectae]|uniref:Uncharacterized protein n=1 Tax=Maritalea myrionectae TaxID=454601 RepID=A0A2R4MCM4_9HYPH|nr:hypothetical protein MXMO3_01260 [Maritalea myrionectae]